MARAKIPDPLARRHLLERDLSEAQAERIAQAYLEEDRAVDAIDFLAKQGDEAGLAALRRRAVEEGDAFLLRAVVRAGAPEPDAAEWTTLAEAAERGGKALYAADARRQAERVGG